MEVWSTRWTYDVRRIKDILTISLCLIALARDAKNPLLTPGPDPSSPSNLTLI